MPAQTEQQILNGITERRSAGIADLGTELRRRIAELGDMPLDRHERQDAFREVIDAYTPAPFDLFAMPDECSIAVADSTIRLSGVIVDTANRQCVGQLQRTLRIDQGFASHDYLALQQGYRANALTPLLITQSFAFYDIIGLVYATVHAALQTGRWYWGRLGFEFITPSERNAVIRWGRAVVSALGIPVDVSGLHEARQWALLGSTDPIVEISLDDIALAMPRASWSHFHGAAIGEYLQTVAEANGLQPNQRIELGRAIMLSGPDWLGYFPLRDSARRQQLALYTNAKLRAAAARAQASLHASGSQSP